MKNEEEFCIAASKFAVNWYEWYNSRGFQTFTHRITAHAGVVISALLVVWFLLPLSSLDVFFVPPVDAFSWQKPSALPLQRTGYFVFLSDPPLRIRANPHTEIPKRPRLGIITYTVQIGDTVQSIATQFGLEPTTIVWANPAVEDAPDLLRIGQELIILPIDGVYHTVKENETLESIAKKYKVEVDAITSCPYNPLQSPDFVIEPGMKLIVPGGQKPWVPKVVTGYTGPIPEGAQGTGLFQWPVLGYITQGYWYGHRAVDIAVPEGTAVRASDRGFVSFSGWTDVGYGYLVIIDHANGFTTYYAHLSNIYVTSGQKVEKGQIIGAIGNTGRSTGPHLHFEIRFNGVQQNPFDHLPDV